MDHIITYLTLSAGMGLLQAADNYKLRVQNGARLAIDWSFSFLELAWVFSSIAILFYDGITWLEITVPAAFIIYYVGASARGIIFNQKYQKEGYQSIFISDWDINAGIIFGLSYLVYSFAILINHQALQPDLSLTEYLLDIKYGIAITLIVIVGIYMSVKRFLQSGMLDFKEGALRAIQENTVCREHLGEISSIELDEAETAEYEEKNVFAFLAHGDIMSGLVVARIESIGVDEDILAYGFIDLENGDRIELDDSMKEI